MMRTITGSQMPKQLRTAIAVAALAGATVLAGTTVLTGAALADVQSGVVKYESGDFSGAIQDWLPLASENDPNALFNLGQIYRLGRGVDKDMPTARNYYERAARLGHVSAQGNLGTLYFFAEPKELKDQEKAVSWWQEAATNGDARSQYMLGVLFFNGDVVGRDWTRAYAWMNLAASAGLPEASQAETSMLKHMTAAQVADAREISLTLVNPAGAFPNSMPLQFAKSSAPVNPATATPVSAVAPASASTVVPIDTSASKPVEMAAAAQGAADMGSEADMAAGDAAQDMQDVLPEPVDKPLEMASASPAVPAEYTAPAAQEMAAAADDMSAIDQADAKNYAYKLQLASFSTQGKANNGWDQFSAKYSDVLAALTPDVIEADLGERGTFYRLFANGFATKGDAASACDNLKAAGQSCMVVSAN